MAKKWIWHGAAATAIFGSLAAVQGAMPASPPATAQPEALRRTVVEPVRLITSDTALECSLDPRPSVKPARTLLCAILIEIARRTGYTGAIEPFPLPRALFVAAAKPNVLVAPVARTPTREDKYSWIVTLLEDDFVFVATRDSVLDISSVESAGELKIGVVRGGVAAQLAEVRHWPRVQFVTRDISNALKLDSGRIDTWVGPWNAILNSQRAAGLPVSALRRGAVLQRVRLYLAGSRELDPAVAAVWKRAFDDMVSDGTYQRLLDRHGFVLPQQR